MEPGEIKGENSVESRNVVLRAYSILSAKVSPVARNYENNRTR